MHSRACHSTKGTAIGLGDVSEPKEPPPDASRVKLEISLFGGGLPNLENKKDNKTAPPKALKLMHSLW